MVLESWDLGTLRGQIRDELNLKSEATVNSQIDDKVNQAVSWICRQRPNWPWMRKEFVIDIAAAGTGVGDFTQGSTSANWDSGTNPAGRDILIVSDSTRDATNGYLVTAFSSPTITLQSQYREATVANKTFQLQTGYKALPTDFLRMDTASDLDSVSGDRLRYATPKLFDHIKRRETGGGVGLPRYYSIVPDPVSLDTSGFYIAFFPYISALTTVQGYYYADPQKLVNDGDVPAIPRNDRSTLFYFACWFMATAKGNERSGIYQNQALDQLRIMLDEYDMSDDLDMSELRDASNWITFPNEVTAPFDPGSPDFF